MPNYNGFNYGPSPMNPGFGPEADFKGKWFSKKTGETVYVRDNIITDTGMQVMLSDGRLLDLNDFGNEYIRVSDEVYDKNGKVIDKSPIDTAENIVPPYFPHDHESNAPVMPPPPPPHHHHHCDCDDKPFVPPIPPIKPCPKPDPDNDPMFREGSHMYMVKSVFENTDPKPNIKPVLTIEPTGFPKEQLQMLINIFGVHIDDIAAYMYKTYFSPAKILGVVKDWLLAADNGGLKEKVVETKPETPATPGDISKPTTDGAEPNPQFGN